LKAMDDHGVPYRVERTARKTIGIYVERDGSVLVRAPEALAPERIEAAVKSRLKWIYRAQARWAALNPSRVQREFVSGETVYFLGAPHRLDFRPAHECGAPIALQGDIFIISREDAARAEELLKGFYRIEGARLLPKLVAERSAGMGVTPKSVRVMELGHRWGSCSDKGNLNFHWKAMALPLDVLSYLVIHELAHLVHRNHSAAFWKVVEAALPGWRPLAGWLDQHGAQMTL
jgi:predicted metal-dependent hydrolase